MDADFIINNYTLEEQEEVLNKIDRNINRKRKFFEKINKEKIVSNTNIGDEVYFIYDRKKYSGELIRKNTNSFVVKFLDDRNHLREERRDYKFFISKI